MKSAASAYQESANSYQIKHASHKHRAERAGWQGLAIVADAR
jgi:hypothetical protein